MNRILLLVCVLLCLSIGGESPYAIAQEPEPTPVPVSGPKAAITDQFGNPLPERVEVSGVLILSAKKAIHGDKPKSVLWRIEPKANAERASFFWDRDAGPLVVLPVLNTETALTIRQYVSKDGEGDLAEVTVMVGKGPRPPPDPRPDPIPDPVTLTGKVQSAVHGLNLTDIQARAEFAVLASVYGTTIPDEIRSGKLKTHDEVLNRVNEMTTAIMQKNMAKWRPGITGIVERHLSTLGITSTTPVTVYISPFSEVSAGINRGLE